jgi:seryl-tRNA(Sec) selenium transferase
MDGLVDTVETNSEILLKVLKSKIEKMFDEEVDEDEVMTLKKAKNPLRINKTYI